MNLKRLISPSQEDLYIIFHPLLSPVTVISHFAQSLLIQGIKTKVTAVSLEFHSWHEENMEKRSISFWTPVADVI